MSAQEPMNERPLCRLTPHCKARREWGDGECGCHHDSLNYDETHEGPPITLRVVVNDDKR